MTAAHPPAIYRPKGMRLLENAAKQAKGTPAFLYTDATINRLIYLNLIYCGEYQAGKRPMLHITDAGKSALESHIAAPSTEPL